ncbi:ring-1,2-phenylacetyl-CoA epoxidase subunit PaaE [Cryobacterium mesophilum]|uniref:Phenylacetate-CoA oxygenase/reductase subunit PaaK n=1 Tax=Terrimesophilobacter mesophilus TaxID=433647 RepID=A0A4R8VE98_9MICO|nr:1,2-phenylacetyl-CoA epoxidase subunit PaaE [Terrimesophilobacter mesophilus]MBB5634041.1 ring-1,2-phenylacetyl-CoA epoxidase subunit PaaE [Terrimesophilobacter mesophilus]TFB81389.1 phenylacetate-CoA oxygenase/reductase subunit PaaK [Terrimesophilobacter mesophilus]
MTPEPSSPVSESLRPAPQRKRARFHPLTVRDVRRLTEDSIEVTFAVPDEFADNYDYEPGQYVALRMTLNGRELRRSYSICAVPVPGELRVAIKRDLGGEFSTWANESLAPGAVIDVMSPQGTFTTERVSDGAERAANRHYAAIAAGSGVTPIMSLARTILRGSEHAQFSLIYSNRTANDVMFLEELAELKDAFPARFALYHVLTRERRASDVLSGRLDAERLGTFLEYLVRPGDVDEWFICGPFELVQLVRDTLEEAGVDRHHVRFELFTTDRPDRPEGSVGRPVIVDEGDAVRKITFTLDGLTASINTPVHGRETILNAALRVRPDVPFACAGGVCGTCRAVLVDGTVTMDENYALEPEELERGYILTCQSHPTSEAVTVNYDS